VETGQHVIDKIGTLGSSSGKPSSPITIVNSGFFDHHKKYPGRSNGTQKKALGSSP
jgi:hypothetical protein